MKAMDYLVKQGLVRLIGVSNFSVAELKEAQSSAKNSIVANQVEYNLLVRDQGKYMGSMESEILPYCQNNGIVFIAWRPLAKGHLAKPGIKLLDEISEKCGRTQAQVALNWLVSKKGVVTITKASDISHIKEDLGALGWKLAKDDVNRLNKEFPMVKSQKEYKKWF